MAIGTEALTIEFRHCCEVPCSNAGKWQPDRRHSFIHWKFRANAASLRYARKWKYFVTAHAKKLSMEERHAQDPSMLSSTKELDSAIVAHLNLLDLYMSHMQRGSTLFRLVRAHPLAIKIQAFLDLAQANRDKSASGGTRVGEAGYDKRMQATRRMWKSLKLPTNKQSY